MRVGAGLISSLSRPKSLGGSLLFLYKRVGFFSSLSLSLQQTRNQSFPNQSISKRNEGALHVLQSKSKSTHGVGVWVCVALFSRRRYLLISSRFSPSFVFVFVFSTATGRLPPLVLVEEDRKKGLVCLCSSAISFIHISFPCVLRSPCTKAFSLFVSLMAGETIDIPMTPEIIEVKEGFLRRVSTGRTNNSSSEEKVSPHYLRASTGSCHDFCKYGREHVFRTKERRASLKGIAVTLDEFQKPLEIATEVKRKKKPLIKKPVASPDLKVQPLDPPKTNKKGTRLLKQEVSPPTKKVDVVMKVASPLRKSYVSTAKKIDVAKTAVSSKPKPAPLKALSSASNHIQNLKGSKSSNIKEVEKNGFSKLNQRKALVLHKVPVSTKPSVSRVASFVNRVATMNARKYSNQKGSSPLKNQMKVKKVDPNPPTDENVSEKTLYIVEPKPGNENLVLAGKGTLTTVSSRSSPSSPPLSPSSSVQEQDKNKDSESTLDEEDGSVSEYEEIENADKVETSNGGPRRAAMNDPKDNDQARKLSFRRGKVVDRHSEYNRPRRLRFREARGLGDYQIGKDTKRKSFKKRAMDNGDTISCKARPIEIVLRRKDANGKKDARLFNKVIEETASKLVQTKKSKVKALVGAFETVISLQEGKSPQTRMIGVDLT